METAAQRVYCVTKGWSRNCSTLMKIIKTPDALKGAAACVRELETVPIRSLEGLSTVKVHNRGRVKDGDTQNPVANVRRVS